MASCPSHNHCSWLSAWPWKLPNDNLLYSTSEPNLPLPPFVSFLFSVIHSLENLNFHAPISFCTNHLANLLTWMSQTTSLFLAGLLGATEKRHMTGKISTLLYGLHLQDYLEGRLPISLPSLPSSICHKGYFRPLTLSLNP